MIRSFVLHDVPIDSFAAVERWYWRDHGPEIARRYGPWAARLESYLPIAVPSRAHGFGFMNWRVTEAWWRSLPDGSLDGALAFTATPAWGRVAPCLTRWQPTQDFRGRDLQPGARPALRWVVMHRFPDGVDPDAADAWFVGDHVPALLQGGQAWRCFSYRTEPLVKLPGHWPEGGALPTDRLMLGWHRLTEFWFDGFSAWETWLDAASALPRPAWAEGAFPFLDAGRNFVSTFILERPADDFLRDHRVYR